MIPGLDSFEGENASELFNALFVQSRVGRIIKLDPLNTQHFDEAMLTSASRIWSDFFSLNHTHLSEGTELATMVSRAVTMLSFNSTYCWINQRLPEAVRVVCLSKDDTERASVERWIVTFVKEARHTFSTLQRKDRQKTVQIRFSSIFEEVSSKTATLEVPRTVPAIETTDEVREITLWAKSVVRQWLGWEEDLKTMVLRACFIRDVIGTGHPGLLLAKCTWDGWLMPLRLVYTNNRDSTVMAARDLMHDCLAHNSNLLRTLSGLDTLLENFWISLPSVVQPASLLQLEEGRNVGRAQNQIEAASKLLAEFWQESALFLSDSTGDFEISRWIGESPDQRLCFRDHAPSRAAMLSDPTGSSHGHRSPFAEDLIRTREGFFSALCFRGVTFSCEVLLKGKRRFFLNPDHFRAETKGFVGLQLCSPTAYSRVFLPVRKEVDKNVEAYWESAAVWVSLIESCEAKGKKIQFEQAVTAMSSNKASNVYKCPGFGKLIAMLAVEDLVYANVVDWPSKEEFARFIVRLKRGAWQGLLKLGVVHQSQSEQSNIINIIQLYRNLERILRETGQLNDFHFDIFVFEHTLCKYSRYKWGLDSQ